MSRAWGVSASLCAGQAVARLAAREAEELKRMPLGAFGGWASCAHCAARGEAAWAADRARCPRSRLHEREGDESDEGVPAPSCWGSDGEARKCPLGGVARISYDLQTSLQHVVRGTSVFL